MKFEDPETGNKVVEIVKVLFSSGDFPQRKLSLLFFFPERRSFTLCFSLRKDLSQVNLTKPEKRGRERKAKAHLESQKAFEQVAITIDNNLILHSKSSSLAHVIHKCVLKLCQKCQYQTLDIKNLITGRPAKQDECGGGKLYHAE